MHFHVDNTPAVIYDRARRLRTALDLLWFRPEVRNYGSRQLGTIQMPSDEETAPMRCEICQLFFTTYLTGVSQLFQMALWLDRQMRFGKNESETAQIIGKIQSHTSELEKSGETI